MKFFIPIILLFSSSVIGGTADLSIELEFNETDGVVFERQGTFTARVTNNGPDIAAIDAPTSNPISLSSGVIRDNGSFTPNVQFAPAEGNDNQNCFFILVIGDPPPGGTVSYVYKIDVPPIPVGETVECLGVFSTHFESGTVEVGWEIRNSFDDDPVSENDTQTVVFGVAPRSVPVNNFYFLIVLLVSVIFFGNNFFKKRTV